VQAREGFDKNCTLDSSSNEATEAVKHAEGVAQVLRHNVVQGKQQDGRDVLSMAVLKDAP
jgi:complex III assembly factor LYRM7